MPTTNVHLDNSDANYATNDNEKPTAVEKHVGIYLHTKWEKFRFAEYTRDNDIRGTFALHYPQALKFLLVDHLRCLQQSLMGLYHEICRLAQPTLRL